MINTILQRLGHFFGRLVFAIVAAFANLFTAIGKIVLNFVLGIFEQVLDRLPDITPDGAAVTVNFARNELEKWNVIFPIYEALGCIGVILAFRYLIMCYRGFCTLMWNMGNIHNAMPKIGGTG